MNDRSRDFQFVEAALNGVIVIHKTCHPGILICFLDTASSWCLSYKDYKIDCVSYRSRKDVQLSLLFHISITSSDGEAWDSLVVDFKWWFIIGAAQKTKILGISVDKYHRLHHLLFCEVTIIYTLLNTPLNFLDFFRFLN